MNEIAEKIARIIDPEAYYFEFSAFKAAPRRAAAYNKALAVIQLVSAQFAKSPTITPALDAAIKDEMTFIPPARCTDKDSCHCHGECMYPGLGCMK